MPQEFKLPDLGEGIHEAQIINVLVKEGDTVAKDQNILEVETDKAAVEIPVPFGGVVSKLFVKTGQTVKVGQPLVAVESATGGAKPAPTDARTAPTPPKPATPPGARPGTPAPAPRPQAPPSSQARPAPVVRGTPSTTPAASPRPSREDHPPRVTTTTPARLSADADVSAPARASTATGHPVPAAPAIRRVAREMNIDLTQVRGTGPGGRIVREDLERFALAGPTGTGGPRAVRAAPVDEMGAGASETLRPAAPSEPLPDFSQWGPIRREPITQIRKTIARQMVRSYTIIPHVTHCDVADVTDLEAFRREHAAVFAERGAKLTLTAFVIKAVAAALQEFPRLNCSFDEPAGEIIFKDYVHIGVAVDTPRGLVVPALRDCHQKSLVQVARELADLAARARESKFDIAELRGGTFTITNVGALGGTFVTPMINYPEVAILGLGRTAPQAVVRNGNIVARTLLPLSLSFDHRVVDGADAARFTRAVIAPLENPLNLLLLA